MQDVIVVTDESGGRHHKVTIDVDTVVFPASNALIAGQSKLDPNTHVYVRYKLYDKSKQRSIYYMSILYIFTYQAIVLRFRGSTRHLIGECFAEAICSKLCRAYVNDAGYIDSQLNHNREFHIPASSPFSWYVLVSLGQYSIL